MIDITSVKEHFSELNEELKKRSMVGEIVSCGGMVILLGYYTERATKKVEAILKPTKLVREACVSVAKKNDLDKHWVCRDLRVFFHADPPREDVFYLSHLRVLAPQAEYILAMKSVVPHPEYSDCEEIKFLIQYLDIETPKDAFEAISKYYPEKKVPDKVEVLIEKLMKEL